MTHEIVQIDDVYDSDLWKDIVLAITLEITRTAKLMKKKSDRLLKQKINREL